MAVIQRRGGTTIRPPTEAVEVTRGASAVMYRVGGHSYPMRSVAQCNTCQSHYRIEIENLLARGYTYATIWRSLPDKGQEAVSIDSMRNHVSNGHMPLDEMTMRVLLEDRAQELGKSIIEGATAMGDHIAFARIGVARALMDIQTGKQHVSVGQAIRMANLLAKVDLAQAAESMDQQSLMEGMMVYWQAVRRVCSPAQVQAIGQAINKNPVIQSLLMRAEEGDMAIEVEATPVSAEGDDDSDE